MTILRSLNRICQLFGLDLPRGVTAISALPVYWRELRQFQMLLRRTDGRFQLTKLYPCLFDRHKESGGERSQYFLQDLYVASLVFQNDPSHHVDVGSRIDGFVAHVASFREIEVFDVRTLSPLPFNVKFTQADLTSPAFDLAEYCDSASCLHALEHFGLGRYGDPLDVDGDTKGLTNLHRMLKPGGILYLSVPIGPQRIEFNAHRVYAMDYLLQLFRGRFDVVRFTLINDSGQFCADLHLDPNSVAGNFDCRYGCGIFELRKV